MILLLILGLALVAAATALFLRAANVSRIRAAETLEQIGAYGFEGRPLRSRESRGILAGAVDRLAGTLGEAAERRLPAESDDAIRAKLVAAGFYSLTPRKFAGYRIISTLAVPGVWLWFVTSGSISPLIAIVGFLAAVFAGWTIPMALVKRQARRRLERIDYKLPELIDLLVVTVEAGISFSASMTIAAERLHGPLGDELRLTMQEQSMGLTANEALANMLERCDTRAMRSFVRSILQGETLGVSIGLILRNVALDMRKRRRAAAEERANKAPVKMLFPLIFMIFPAIFVVLLGPAVYALLIRTLSARAKRVEHRERLSLRPSTRAGPTAMCAMKSLPPTRNTSLVLGPKHS